MHAFVFCHFTAMFYVSFGGKIIFFFDPEVFFILNSHTFANYLPFHFISLWNCAKKRIASILRIISSFIIEIYDKQFEFY